jgi:hypothetical protein
MKEGSTKVVGVVEDDNLPRAVYHEEEIVDLVELRHFHVGICFEVYHTSETGNVSVARLFHPGEQVEEDITGGMEGHGAFYFYVMLRLWMASASTTTRGCFRNDKRIPPRDPGCQELPLCAGIHWRKEPGMGGRFPPIPSLLLPPNKILYVWPQLTTPKLRELCSRLLPMRLTVFDPIPQYTG